MLIFMPYYTHAMNAAHLAAASAFLWTVLCFTLNNFYPETDAAVLLYCGVPVAAIAGLTAANYRANLVLRTPPSQLGSVYDVELRGRYMLHAALWGHPLEAVGHVGDGTLGGAAAAGGRAGAGEASSEAAAQLLDGEAEDHDDRAAALRRLIPPDVIAEVQALFRLATSRFRTSALLHVFCARFYAIYLGNRHMQFSHLLQAEKRSPPLDVSFLVFQARRVAEDASGGSMSAINRVTFEKFAADARRHVQRAASTQAAFWAELTDTTPDLAKLHTLAAETNKSIVAAERAFTELFAINASSLTTIRLYAAFCSHVTCNVEKATTLTAEADRIEDQKAKDHTLEGGQRLQVLAESPLDVMAENTAVITVSATSRNLGTLLSINAAGCKLLGYARMQLERRSVFTLLPSPIDALHESALKYYVATGEGTIVDYTRIMFAVHKTGTLIPVLPSVRDAPADGGQPTFIWMLRELRTASQFMMLRDDWVVTAVSPGSLSLLGVPVEALASGHLCLADLVAEWSVLVPEMQSASGSAVKVVGVGQGADAAMNLVDSSSEEEESDREAGDAASSGDSDMPASDDDSHRGSRAPTPRGASERRRSFVFATAPITSGGGGGGALHAAPDGAWIRANLQRCDMNGVTFWVLHWTRVPSSDHLFISKAEARRSALLAGDMSALNDVITRTVVGTGATTRRMTTHTGAVPPAATTATLAHPTARRAHSEEATGVRSQAARAGSASARRPVGSGGTMTPRGGSAPPTDTRRTSLPGAVMDSGGGGGAFLGSALDRPLVSPRARVASYEAPGAGALLPAPAPPPPAAVNDDDDMFNDLVAAEPGGGGGGGGGAPMPQPLPSPDDVIGLLPSRAAPPRVGARSSSIQGLLVGEPSAGVSGGDGAIPGQPAPARWGSDSARGQALVAPPPRAVGGGSGGGGGGTALVSRMPTALSGMGELSSRTGTGVGDPSAGAAPFSPPSALRGRPRAPLRISVVSPGAGDSGHVDTGTGAFRGAANSSPIYGGGGPGGAMTSPGMAPQFRPPMPRPVLVAGGGGGVGVVPAPRSRGGRSGGESGPDDDTRSSGSSTNTSASKALTRLRRLLVDGNQALLPGLWWLRIIGLAITLLAVALAATVAVLARQSFLSYKSNVDYMANAAQRMLSKADAIYNMQDLMFDARGWVPLSDEEVTVRRAQMAGNASDFADLNRRLFAAAQGSSIATSFTTRYITVTRFDVPANGLESSYQYLNLQEAAGLFANTILSYSRNPLADFGQLRFPVMDMLYSNYMRGGNAHEALQNSMTLGYLLTLATKDAVYMTQVVVFVAMICIIMLIGAGVFFPILRSIENTADGIMMQFVGLPSSVRGSMYAQAAQRVRMLRRDFAVDDEVDVSSDDDANVAMGSGDDGLVVQMEQGGASGPDGGMGGGEDGDEMGDDAIDWNALLGPSARSVRVTRRTTGASVGAAAPGIDPGTTTVPSVAGSGAAADPTAPGSVVAGPAPSTRRRTHRRVTRSSAPRFRKSGRSFMMLLARFLGPLGMLLLLFIVVFSVFSSTLSTALTLTSIAAAAGTRASCARQAMVDLRKLEYLTTNAQYIINSYWFTMSAVECVRQHVRLLGYADPTVIENAPYQPYTPAVENGAPSVLAADVTQMAYNAMFANACPFMDTIGIPGFNLSACESMSGGVLTNGLAAATELWYSNAYYMGDRQLRGGFIRDRLLQGYGWLLPSDTFNYSTAACVPALGCSIDKSYAVPTDGSVLPPTPLPDYSWNGDYNLTDPAPPGAVNYSIGHELTCTWAG